MSDPGIAVVNHIYTGMKIDPEWSVREERGFTWWGKDFAQRVWAEPAFEDSTPNILEWSAFSPSMALFKPCLPATSSARVFMDAGFQKESSRNRVSENSVGRCP